VPVTYTPRTRTAPDLKWLLNERAAVAGTLTRLLSRRESLVARLARTEQLLARTRIAIAGADSGLATQRQALAALDHALALMHPTVSPAVVGEVVPWAGKYGRKGGLTEFVKSVIKNSYPEPVPTVTIRKQPFQLGTRDPQRRCLPEEVHPVRDSKLARGRPDKACQAGERDSNHSMGLDGQRLSQLTRTFAGPDRGTGDTPCTR
jgi:hypothetical protein